MGEAVAAKVSLGKSELLSGTNTWTGVSNTFNNGVSIGDLTALRAATFNDNVTISGNLTVNGTTTALSTTEMEVKDNFIHLSKGANVGPYAKDSGFYFERGSGSDAQAFIWDESEGEFVLGGLQGGGSTKSITFTGVSAQIGTAATGATVDASVSGALGLTSSFAGGGTVNDPENFYVLTGSTDGKEISIDGNTITLNASIGQMGTGLYIWTSMDGSGNMRSKYAVIVYVANGDTLADVTKLHVWEEGFGAFINSDGQYYTNTTLATGTDMDNNPLSHTNGYTSSGTGIITLTISDTSASVGTDSSVQAFTTGSYPATASITTAGAVTYTAGTYDVTFTLKGQLASDIDSFQIVATDGGSTATDYNSQTTPFAYNTGTLSYIADSADPYSTFQKLAVDASKLAYSSSNTSTNGGYYIASSTDGTQLEVSFDTTPGSSDYIGLAHGSSVSMPVPAIGSADGPDAETATVTPGSLRVGSVTITDQTDGELALGDLTDFEAGLAS